MWWEKGGFYVAILAVVVTVVVSLLGFRQAKRHHQEDQAAQALKEHQQQRSDRGILTTDPVVDVPGSSRRYRLRVTNAGTKPLNDVYCALVDTQERVISESEHPGEYIGPLMPGDHADLEVAVRAEFQDADPLSVRYIYYDVGGDERTYLSRSAVPRGRT